MAGRKVLRHLVALGLLAAGAVLPGPVLARPPLPVAVYLNVDEVGVLLPFRDRETGRYPQQGEPGYEAYHALREGVLAQAVKELRRRVPKDFLLFAARGPKDPYAVKIDLWIADVATSCESPESYKYLWVRTYQRDDGITTNWDRLGVRSQTLVNVRMPPARRVQADTDSWVEVWAQVPYLHLQPAEKAPAAPDYTPVPEPEAGS